MLNIVLAVLFSSLLYLLFKLFGKFNIHNLQAIIFNYLTAFCIGYALSPIPFSVSKSIDAPWFYGSVFLGLLFICVFYILGKTIQVNGISVASVSSKMAVIIPILFGIFVFNEKLNISKLTGITIALFAVYLTSKKESGKFKASNYLLPILLFFGAGLTDTSMNYIQHMYISEQETGIFASFTFVFAFIFGLLFIVAKSSVQEIRIKAKNIVAGILLGIPNYFSMYYFIKALQNKNLESATIFTLINIGVILLTSLFSMILFKEQIKKENIIGILLAIIAILLITP